MKVLKTKTLAFELPSTDSTVDIVDTEPGRRPTLGVIDDLKDIGPDIQATILQVCSMAEQAFDRLNHPTELKVKFGIKLGGQTGIPVVAKGTAEASFEVEATWTAGREPSGN